MERLTTVILTILLVIFQAETILAGSAIRTRSGGFVGTKSGNCVNSPSGSVTDAMLRDCPNLAFAENPKGFLSKLFEDLPQAPGKTDGEFVPEEVKKGLLNCNPNPNAVEGPKKITEVLYEHRKEMSPDELNLGTSESTKGKILASLHKLKNSSGQNLLTADSIEGLTTGLNMLRIDTLIKYVSAESCTTKVQYWVNEMGSTNFASMLSCWDDLSCVQAQEAEFAFDPSLYADPELYADPAEDSFAAE